MRFGRHRGPGGLYLPDHMLLPEHGQERVRALRHYRLQVGAAVEPGALVFHSIWDAATGTTDAAVLDGAKWQNAGGDNGAGTVLEVIAPNAVNGTAWTGAGNVLKVSEHNSDYVIASIGDVPQSTTHWGRKYIMFETGALPTRNEHPCCYDLVGNIDIVYLGWGNSGGKWHISVVVGPLGETWWFVVETAGTPILLDVGVWYRFEWMVEYVTPTTVKFWPRIYNLAGTLLGDSDDFCLEDNWGTTLTEWWATNTHTVIAVDMQEVGFGNPSSIGVTGQDWYVADYALSTEGWIGA